MSDGDMRMLGAVDGFAHSLVRVRQEIHSRTYYPIDKRHTRRIAAREAILRPLRELEAWLVKNHADCKAAYVKTTES